ncbi:Ubiquinone biosynthesis monooxygenase COQ6, mitochondrial [Neolecta irregularis DAH-3]|uniref:Ubiquinone biosynthesis monooxygenase COQ6, mitochondrial n=1 Tax=Neolecta irregularis (strain DAH-3) TaxID=1198029 RepID=A0A1U7LJA0_NEOID|nr:Ubiquinone biosynthesis monooxygenase COQ6, mitochondrial [Neolecta irregularis DAH-3]|eukprot:OLL22727.1 Ubiquinone biosynthesis monooxygenase COQ6, mitochondrial [Neolecta irregularis DAH-3]
MEEHAIIFESDGFIDALYGQFSQRWVLQAVSLISVDIGAWKFIDGSRVQAYKDMQVWDGISGSRITFPSDEPHGTITEISNLQNCLLDRLNELGRVDIFSQQQVLNITRPDEFPVISLSSGKAIESRLLIGADGVNSPVRTFASIESRGWDYGHGVVSTLKTSRPTLTAWQRFLPTGPIALLPVLPDGYASLVWSTTSQLANRFKSMSSRDFSALITAAFRLTPTDLSYISTESSDIADEVSWRLQCTRVDGDVPPSVLEASNIACFPLRMRHADTYISDRVALDRD